jgi:pentatricopeptide repeat protein
MPDSESLSEELKLLCSQAKLKEALDLVHSTRWNGVCPTSADYVCIVQGCIRYKAIAEGKALHAHILNTGITATIFLWTSIMNMYIQWGDLAEARQVFDSIPGPDLIAWNMMIGAYAKFAKPRLAFQLFGLLECEELRPDSVTLVSILKACSSASDLNLGMYIHGHMMKFGVEISLFSANTLINMYAKCGSVENARGVFDKMGLRNVVSWTAMIAGYAKHDRCAEALCLYRRMLGDGILPNEVTFVSVLNACAGMGDLEEGKSVSMDVKRSGIKPNLFMENASIDMFVKCGSFGDAWKIFTNMAERDVITWTTIIAGCAQQGYSDKAFSLLEQMKQEGLEPGDVSLVSKFNAFGSLGNLEHARTMHALVSKFLNKPNDFVGSALVDMYIKCKGIDDAKRAFCQLPKKDIILWNAMLSGYIVDGNVEESIGLLHQMDVSRMAPNDATFTIVLNTCANTAALEYGEYIHARIAKVGLGANAFIGSALVNMYTKCGVMREAEHVFYNVAMRDIVLYTSMIAGYAQHSEGHAAVRLASEMWQEGLKPNHVTFVGVLSACSHAGLIEEAIGQLDRMRRFFGIEPITEHFVCIVDLLGRAGCLEEAQLYIDNLTCKPNAMVWRALLGACRVFDDIERAKFVAKCVIELLPEDEGAFVLFSNICGAAVAAYDD